MTGIFGPIGTQPPEPTATLPRCTNCGDPCTVPPLCSPCRYPRTGRDEEGHGGGKRLGPAMPKSRKKPRRFDDSLRMTKADEKRTAEAVAKMDPFYKHRREQSQRRRK